MFDRLQSWMASKRYPELDWLQVEVTTRCTAACGYCPRTVYADRWQNRDISPELFRKALPIMKKSRIVHLQGWGEPFLHPDFFSFVRLAKQQGCSVTTTTNGTLIGDAEVEAIFAAGLDMVSFSLAGFGESNDTIRRGTDSAQITAAIRKIHLKKLALKKTTPRVHVSFLLLSSTLREIEKMPLKLAGIGVDEVVISTLDFVAEPRLHAEAIRPVSRADYAWLCDELGRIAEQCRRAGILVHFRLPAPDVMHPTCTENVLKSAFLRSDGTVSPCVFSAIPVSDAAFHDGHQMQTYAPILFGSIAETPFPVIWTGPGPEAFRKSFAEGAPMLLCRTCPKRSE